MKVWMNFGNLWGHSSLQTASEVKSDLRFKIRDSNYLLIYVPIVDLVRALFGILWGHYRLQTASEVKSALRFEISDPMYLLIDMHIIYMVWAPFGSLWGHYNLQTASKVKSDLRLKIESAGEIGDPNILYDKVSSFLDQPKHDFTGRWRWQTWPLTCVAITAGKNELMWEWGSPWAERSLHKWTFNKNILWNI